MGTTVKAVLVLGTAVDPRGFDREAKAFDHDFPPTMRFDPRTGRELWMTESGLDDASDDSLEVVSTGDEDAPHYLGTVLSRTPYGEMAVSLRITPEALAEETEKVRTRLVRFGVQDPDVRLWTVIAWS